jgi:hypothetical protein
VSTSSDRDTGLLAITLADDQRHVARRGGVGCGRREGRAPVPRVGFRRAGPRCADPRMSTLNQPRLDTPSHDQCQQHHGRRVGRVGRPDFEGGVAKAPQRRSRYPEASPGFASTALWALRSVRPAWLAALPCGPRVTEKPLTSTGNRRSDVGGNVPEGPLTCGVTADSRLSCDDGAR